MTSRRALIKTGAIAAIAGAVPSSVAFADPMPGATQTCRAPSGLHGHLRLFANGGRRTADQRSRKPRAEDRFEVSGFNLRRLEPVFVDLQDFDS